MAFWSQGSFSDPRRTRSGIPSTSAARTAAANMFRDRDSPEANELLFEAPPTFPARSRWSDRMTSVFDDFPSRRLGSSLHRRQPPNWMNETRGSKESSPAGSDSSLPRRASFHRADSIPIRVSHESRPDSRSSTPESTGSGSVSSRPSSGSADQNHHHDTDVLDGVEEYPMPTTKAGKQGFMARHQPKVHHIPIHVEPRDGAQAFTTVTPPIMEASQAPSFNVSLKKSQSMSTPVEEVKQPCHPTEQAQHEVRPERTSKIRKNISSSSRLNEENHDLPSDQNEEKAEIVEPQPMKPKKKTPFETLEEISVNVDKLRQNVADFNGAKGDKYYLYLDEMLTRDLIRLDNIETEGNEELRQARRAVIVTINKCIQELEQNANCNDATAAASSDIVANDPNQEEPEAMAEVEQVSLDCQAENQSTNSDAQNEDLVLEEVLIENNAESSETATEPFEEKIETSNAELEIETTPDDKPAPILEENDKLESQPIVQEPMECGEPVTSDEVKID